MVKVLQVVSKICRWTWIMLEDFDFFPVFFFKWAWHSLGAAPRREYLQTLPPPGHVARLNPTVVLFCLTIKAFRSHNLIHRFSFEHCFFLGKSSVQTTNPKRFLTCFVVEFAWEKKGSPCFLRLENFHIYMKVRTWNTLKMHGNKCEYKSVFLC